MKTRIIVMAVTVLIMATFMIAFSQDLRTIKGEVIDVSCYVAQGAKGLDHKTCALACLGAGEPAGILEEGTGKVYLVVTGDHTTNPSTKMLPYVAKMVEATGTVNEKGGVATIDIKDIKEAENPSMGMGKETMQKTSPSEKKGMMGY